MDQDQIAKLFILVGLVLVGFGLLALWGDKLPFMKELGLFPGDIVIKKEKFSIYFPLTTSIVLSIVLSLLLWLFTKKG